LSFTLFCVRVEHPLAAVGRPQCTVGSAVDVLVTPLTTLNGVGAIGTAHTAGKAGGARHTLTVTRPAQVSHILTWVVGVRKININVHVQD